MEKEKLLNRIMDLIEDLIQIDDLCENCADNWLFNADAMKDLREAISEELNKAE